ncbi:hypothetical protein [Spirosoma aerophilum]
MKRWTLSGLLVSVGIFVFWYAVRLPRISFRKDKLLTASFNKKYNETGVGASWVTPVASLFYRAMNEAVKRGFYVYSLTYLTPYEKVPLSSRH